MTARISQPESTGRAARILRFSAAMCFIGHGAWGVITKAAWVPFFAVVGIPEAWAWRLMPLVGTVDILLGVAILYRPQRALLLWMTVWTLWTALLRPLSGDTHWEVWERAGNVAPPLALLLLGGPFAWTRRELFGGLDLARAGATAQRYAAALLRVALALLLAGHGAFHAVVHKAGLLKHFAALGVPLSAGQAAYVGVFEWLLAALVLWRPRPALLAFVLAWKVGTEGLYVLLGPVNVFEWLERFGDYAIPAALIVMASRPGSLPFRRPLAGRAPRSAATAPRPRGTSRPS